MNAKLPARIGAVLFALSAGVFILELFGEVTGIWLIRADWFIHEVTELATLVGFIIGGVFIYRAQLMLSQRNEDVEFRLRAARGEFNAMVQQQFEKWQLSTAERDVALLTVKGLTLAEIADARSTSQGTVKSQNNAIYRKAGVKNRTQLLGALIDELLFDDG
ncbi:helix-turn-helix transcriptional regulator [Aliiroseovarius lamellibrachiae]|uniref:helix-turn-helix transcriptional regulator n=1 Tax=Aliiroseovarius lamellibrachiae TaxID=1924933 RepID=UPI001BE123A4|nr:helix-turn-helix transcriptional regulator [Aliiroseovarius lamellibrachiae]MBT2130866.1 helix-turn-helix transcriptional regulator [Aliiroseovarius lamellibrachiae]